MSVTDAKWTAVRTAVLDTTKRFADLVSTTSKAGARATERWSVAETAAHVITVASLHNVMMLPNEEPSIPIPGVRDLLTSATVDTVSPLNEVALKHFPERDPRRLAERLHAEVDRLVAAADAKGKDAAIEWLGGARVPVVGILAHILNELSIHGRDIARATKAQWTIPPQDAAMFFEHFVVGMVKLDHGRLLETPEPSEERVSVHFRSEYLDPVTLVLDKGRVTAEPSDDVDVRITFDPTTFNLMMFGRISPPRAMLTGKVSVAGRRPWRLPIFLKTVRMPS